MEDDLNKPYKLPNGGLLRPGCRVRVPAEHIWLIPEEDIRKYGLTLGERYSPYSEVIEREALEK